MAVTRTVEGVVSQVLTADELDDYVIPPEIYDGVEPDEDLVVLVQDPLPERIRRILGWWPVYVVCSSVLFFPAAILGRPIPDQDPVEIAAPAGSLEEGEHVELEVAEAVVDETRTRGDTTDRVVHLYEVVA